MYTSPKNAAEAKARLEVLEQFQRSDMAELFDAFLEANEQMYLANVCDPGKQEFLQRNAGSLAVVRAIRAWVATEIAALKQYTRDSDGT